MAEEAPGAGPAAVSISLSPLLPPPQMVVVAQTPPATTARWRYIRRLGFEGGHIVDPHLGELLCPVCRRFANSILPASPDFSGITRKAMPIAQTTPTEAAASIHNLQSPRALALLESARKIVGQSTFLKAFPGNVNDTAEPALDPSLRRLAMLYYPCSKSSFSASERLSPSLFLSETLRELNSSSGFILSLLFRVSHSARVLNRREVLLRFEGTSLPMVDPESEGEIFPDIQFWKQCADPVLAQDPFSSLMSALFCLPIEVLTSTEFFIPIVHLFYIVCVIQALITCYGQEAFDRSIFRGCLLNDVCQEMLGYDIAREYFVSKHIDPSCEKCPISIYIREVITQSQWLEKYS
ncbi:E3 ubiquitin-protein ligase PRT6 [Hordeum vulgare]|nr:E3 ubiquitin-protein ligase PRT6 [Hordeum vulgare]